MNSRVGDASEREGTLDARLVPLASEHPPDILHNVVFVVCCAAEELGELREGISHALASTRAEEVCDRQRTEP